MLTAFSGDSCSLEGVRMSPCVVVNNIVVTAGGRDNSADWRLVLS
jgi:hypothetical protein